MQERKLLINRRAFIGGAAVFSFASLTSLSSLLRPSLAYAVPTAAEKQAEADAVRHQVEILKAELLEKSNIYGAALDAHDAALLAMEEAQEGINTTTAKIGALQGRLGIRARSMYRSGSSTFLDIIFAATSFEEFVTNWDILNKMNVEDASMVSEAKTLREELEATKEEYSKQEKLAAEKTEEAKKAKEETEAAAAHYQGLLDSLDAEVLALIIKEQEAAAAAAAAVEISRQRPGSNGTRPPANAADFGPPAGDILSEAVKYIGLPYVWGAADPSVGFDCSGLVWYCCMRTGHSIPPRSTYGYGGGWFAVSESQPGDILWQPEHVGICAAAGGSSYVHAANEQYGICYGSSPQFTRAYRF